MPCSVHCLTSTSPSPFPFNPDIICHSAVWPIHRRIPSHRLWAQRSDHSEHWSQTCCFTFEKVQSRIWWRWPRWFLMRLRRVTEWTLDCWPHHSFYRSERPLLTKFLHPFLTRIQASRNRWREITTKENPVETQVVCRKRFCLNKEIFKSQSCFPGSTCSSDNIICSAAWIGNTRMEDAECWQSSLWNVRSASIPNTAGTVPQSDELFSDLWHQHWTISCVLEGGKQKIELPSFSEPKIRQTPPWRSCDVHSSQPSSTI